MQDSSYSAMFGALTNEHRLNVIANNLANVNTTGYKRDQLSFKDTFISFAHDKIMEPVMNVRQEKLFPEPVHIAKPRLAQSKIVFEQGSMRKTDSPFDFAIAGSGFFRVQTDQGPFLTRNGHFQVNAEGTLVTEQGFSVLAGGGPITIPTGAQVVVNGGGEILVDGENLGALDVVSVDDEEALEKQGRNLYRIREGSQAQELPATDVVVNQGYLEAANVNVVTEMVNMIEAQRSFEGYQKMISSTHEMDEKSITRFGMVK